MLIYFDTSALVKRGIVERETDDLEAALVGWAVTGDFASSSIAWLEVSRALRRRREAEPPGLVTGAVEYALSGIAEFSLSPETLALARRIEPRGLRALDALHLASAILLDATVLCSYDDRLLAAAEEHGLRTASPGR